MTLSAPSIYSSGSAPAYKGIPGGRTFTDSEIHYICSHPNCQSFLSKFFCDFSQPLHGSCLSSFGRLKRPDAGKRGLLSFQWKNAVSGTGCSGQKEQPVPGKAAVLSSTKRGSHRIPNRRSCRYCPRKGFPGGSVTPESPAGSSGPASPGRSAVGRPHPPDRQAARW